MNSSLRHYVLLTLALTFGAGCSSIVKKPDIHQVKKIAIISVTAPQKVPNKSGKGEVQGFDETNRIVIADQALAVYEAEFKKLGWEVIPASRLATLPAYKENFAPGISKADNAVVKTLNKIAAMNAENMYFSPTGLYPVAWENDGSQGTLKLSLDLNSMSTEKGKALKAKMREVASAAGADAAVLVQADYCYEDGGASVWIGNPNLSANNAVITGTSAIYSVNNKGVEVIKMKRIPKSCGGDRRVASNSSTPMVRGMLVFSRERIQKMFQEVTQKNAAENIKQIQAAMKD